MKYLPLLILLAGGDRLCASVMVFTRSSNHNQLRMAGALGTITTLSNLRLAKGVAQQATQRSGVAEQGDQPTNQPTNQKKTKQAAMPSGGHGDLRKSSAVGYNGDVATDARRTTEAHDQKDTELDEFADEHEEGLEQHAGTPDDPLSAVEIARYDKTECCCWKECYECSRQRKQTMGRLTAYTCPDPSQGGFMESSMGKFADLERPYGNQCDHNCRHYRGNPHLRLRANPPLGCPDTVAQPRFCDNAQEPCRNYLTAGGIGQEHCR